MPDSFIRPHGVLSVPELLYNTFSFMNRDENVINAYVCKQWSDIALDLIWREVNNLPQLLNILRPYQACGRVYSFVEQPDSEDWIRFQKYANRVRTLRYCQGQNNYSSMLEDIARTRLTFEILPNLHTLEWLFEDVRCMERAMVFMHQHVRHLIISAPPLSCKSKSSFFVDISVRMPHLRSLDLRVTYPAQLIEGTIVELLRRMPDLEIIRFPEFYFTSTVVSELSRMKHIQTIRFVPGTKRGHWKEADVDSSAPVLAQGAFPMLLHLYITACLGDAARFMNTDFAPTNLISLYISTYVEHKPDQLHTFLIALSNKCHCLLTLYINLLHVPEKPKIIPANQITFDTLRPILSFQELVQFQIMHKYPVNITLEEIEELASQLPSLQRLYLNEAPLVMSDATLDLRALVHFARHCPKLHTLGLYMDGTIANIHGMQELKPFTALHRLLVGTSQLHDPDAVTAFLSHMCPPQCELSASISWTSRSCRKLDDDVLTEIANRSACWERVRHLLPIFTQLRRDEQEKSKALIAALRAELRSKNRLLVANSTSSSPPMS